METQSRSINQKSPLTALHLDMKDTAEKDQDDKDDTDDNREGVSMVQDEVVLPAHFRFQFFNLSVQQFFKFLNDMGERLAATGCPFLNVSSLGFCTYTITQDRANFASYQELVRPATPLAKSFSVVPQGSNQLLQLISFLF